MTNGDPYPPLPADAASFVPAAQGDGCPAFASHPGAAGALGGGEGPASACRHCNHGSFKGTDVACVNGVLIDIDEAQEGWDRDARFPAAPCVSKSGKWPRNDIGCQARLKVWATSSDSVVSDAAT